MLIVRDENLAREEFWAGRRFIYWTRNEQQKNPTVLILTAVDNRDITRNLNV